MNNQTRLVVAALPLMLWATLPGACTSSGGGGGEGGNAGDGAGGAGEGGAGEGGAGGADQGGSAGTAAGEGGAGGGKGGSAPGTGGSVGAGGAGGAGGASANGGAGGKGGAGGTAGAGGNAGAGGAVAAKKAVATLAGIEGGTITGTVTFTQEGTSVTVVYALSNCPAGQHGTHIHAGSGCGDRQQQGMHWDGKRGEGINTGSGVITCGADMKGMLTYTRTGADPATRWTIGDGSATDIVGHPLIVHGLADADRHGCGVITKSP